MISTTREYYKLSPAKICEDVNESNQNIIQASVEGIDFAVFPHVYPSHKFRTTSFLLKSLKRLVKGKKVCDMGCGPGIVGLYAKQHGAKQVVQADINPNAVENAKQNNMTNGFEDTQIKTYLSDCFDSIPKEIFDIIVFNMPYHCDKIKIDDPLKYAFYDPAFTSIKKFLKQAKKYSHKKTQIFIAFSNKGEVSLLESIFEENNYEWELWKVTNTDKEYDNRIYRLRVA